MNAQVDVSVMQTASTGVSSPILRCFVAIAACLAWSSMPAHAAGDDATWVCWNGDAKAIVCQLSGTGADLSDGAPAPENASPGTVDDPYVRLPPLARAILRDPGRLKGRRISIPMFNDPEDHAFMVELAEAVMCGTKSNCAVQFVDGGTKVALLLDELYDPALN